jgi:DNA-binding transcriptional ArsR family regulator
VTDAVFDALGDPVRRRILELLGDGEQPAGAVADALHDRFGISQPATSQHLRVLRLAGLVSVRPEGTRRIYAVDAGGLITVHEWLARFADPFAQPLDALATELVRGRRERRRGGDQPTGQPTDQSAGERRTHGATA